MTTRPVQLRSGCYDRGRMSPGYYLRAQLYEDDGSYSLQQYGVGHKMSTSCRQIGVLVNGRWEDLAECAGCSASRDKEFINHKRAEYEAALQSTRLQGTVCACSHSGVQTK